MKEEWTPQYEKRLSIAMEALKALSKLKPESDFDRSDLFDDGHKKSSIARTLMMRLMEAGFIRKEKNGPQAFYILVERADIRRRLEELADSTDKAKAFIWPNGIGVLPDEEGDENPPESAPEEQTSMETPNMLAPVLPPPVPAPVPFPVPAPVAHAGAEYPQTLPELSRLCVAIAENQIALSEKLDEVLSHLKELKKAWGVTS